MTRSRAPLLHRLAETGATVRAASPRTADSTLPWLRPALAAALATGDATPLCDTGWWMACALSRPSLRVQLWKTQWAPPDAWPAPRPGARPHIRMAIDSPAGSVPAMVEASRAGLATIPDPVLAATALREAPHLERSIAWAWLTARR